MLAASVEVSAEAAGVAVWAMRIVALPLSSAAATMDLIIVVINEFMIGLVKWTESGLAEAMDAARCLDTNELIITIGRFMVLLVCCQHDLSIVL